MSYCDRKISPLFGCHLKNRHKGPHKAMCLSGTYCDDGNSTVTEHNVEWTEDRRRKIGDRIKVLKRYDEDVTPKETQ